MAVQHPVAGIVCDKFDVARLRHTDEHRVPWAPGRFRLSPSFCSRDYKLVAVEVDRMVVHAEVDQANPYAFTVPHNQGSRRRPRSTVECEPVELHIHRVRNGDIRQDGVLLRMMTKSLSTRGL